MKETYIITAESVADVDAQEVLGYVIYNDRRHIKLPYPLQGFDTNVTGKSFHNGRFVQRLRNIAASLPNITLEQGTVKSLLKENGIVKGVEYKTRNGQEMTAYASLTSTCDGCFLRLWNSLCNAKEIYKFLFYEL
ncbi:Squalene monooxygenase isoform 3 [Tripterygium wilfordii]|uniref:Squalene monooxygenase n=1 Tax=Tripterygium wilfordii TaxID=458696 RepID=A0A7J7CGR7_TRIWF|nr:Squalene monooxygenase isoform 3 [Tripterygium wilfordii]